MTAVEPMLETQTRTEVLAGRVDRAIAAAQALDSDASQAATEVKEATEAFHREVLMTIVQRLKEDPRGKELLFELVDDETVYSALVLHNIVRTPPMVRALEALATVRPYLESHGGDVELQGIDGGVAKVKLLGSCNGCSMSSQTLTNAVQTALVEHVPEIQGIEVVPDDPTPSLISADSLSRRPATTEDQPAESEPVSDGERSGWVRGPSLLEIGDPGLARFDAGGSSFAVVQDGGVIAVFRNECGHLGLELDGADVGGGRVVCDHHGFQFDVMTGAGMTDPASNLTPVPSRVEGIHVWLRPPQDGEIATP